MLAALLIGSALAGLPATAVDAQGHGRRGGTRAPVAVPIPDAAPAPVTGAAPAGSGTVKSIDVDGVQRLEPDTVRSYIKLHPGDHYDREALDQALKDLYGADLFADVTISGADTGALVIHVRENPVINRIVLEGNKRLKEDKIRPEIKLAPREIFTRSKVRADVNRIIELYKRQGRFAASVEPKMVLLDQNRVDIVFEIHEGDKSKVRKINIIGNNHFSDGRLRAEMATKQSGITKIFSSGTSYDPDRLAYDQQKLRQFYLTEGYADFHVVSAVAELTPDKRDFIITYVVDEGDRYHFGDVDLKSQIRDLQPNLLKYLIRIKKGDWYNAKQVEDTNDSLTEAAGLAGYAFADVHPSFERDKDARTMGITFVIGDTPRVYVERVDINGNTITRDKVVRREFRLAEGDAFNGFSVKRSRDRIQSLGYFQDKLEINQKQGSTPDRVILEANLQEKATGQLQLSAGYSSYEKFIVSGSITQNNFMGKGQTVSLSADYSIYSKSVDLGFQEPYLFNKSIAVGGDIFRRELNQFSIQDDSSRKQTYNQVSTGFQIRSGVPLTEYWSLALRYQLSNDKVSLDSEYYSIYNEDGTIDPTGASHCDVALVGRYLCDSVGTRLTSSLGYSLVNDTLNDRRRPTSGHRVVFNQDFAGIGGSVHYIKTQAEAHQFFNLGSGFILSANGEGGYIHSLDSSKNGEDPLRIVDRFFLGQPQFPGFDIRGIGPRVIRYYYNSDGTLNKDRSSSLDDALGGRAYYMAKAELELPLGNGGRELGIRPSIYAIAGSVFGLNSPTAQTIAPGSAAATRQKPNGSGGVNCDDVNGAVASTIKPGGTCPSGQIAETTAVTPFSEIYYPGTWKPRVSVGFGINWNSPFGPFRIDIAKALVKYDGDDTKLFTFNVGTQF